MKVILLLVYLLKGEIVVEQIPQPNLAACDKLVTVRHTELMLNPAVDVVIAAGCAVTKAQAASNK